MATKCPESEWKRPLRICDNTHFLSPWIRHVKRTIFSSHPPLPLEILFNFYICMKYTLCVPHLMCEISKIKR
uniref:Uncharacterized protein n=1 Tax=Anguilla anguilla TaxID=7936 RepID=A0A0E9X3Z9_ANGAN